MGSDCGGRDNGMEAADEEEEEERRDDGRPLKEEDLMRVSAEQMSRLARQLDGVSCVCV